ncbi:ATP-dependent DNA helicase [Trichonephila clavipes]|nr:ATP-dependent DNA helicase [Trichonephila clavipes]
MSLIGTNGLPYQTIYVNNIYYMITTNIDVTDGLANGAVGKLIHVETNHEGLVKTIWLEFPDLPQIGGKLRHKKTFSPYLYKIENDINDKIKYYD